MEITVSNDPEHPSDSPENTPEDAFGTRAKDGLDNLARSVSQGGATTLFQPGVMIDSILDHGDTATGSSTWVLQGTPKAPPLPTSARPFFLLLGAAPGQARILLPASRTVFGRDEGDVLLRDPSVSARHFQVDVVGNEYFVRDLGSRNGTLLNGHPVRYSEILPGDELRVGESTLVFRLEGDGISDRPAPRADR